METGLTLLPMLRSYRIGRLFGFPIDVNLSFLLMLGVVLLWTGGLSGVFIVLLAFASVLLHELGHAVVARRLGVPVPGIELHFFGGAAKLGSQPDNANHEIAIAAAGPAVSFALGGLGLGLAALTGSPLLSWLGWINVVLGAFNLMPALPMDGGRIFRALLSKRFRFVRATEIAVTVSKGFAIALGVFALATQQLYLVLLAAVLWFLSKAELAAARQFGYREQPQVVTRGPRMPNPGAPPPSGRTGVGGFVIRRDGQRVIIDVVR
jgi:Zn-dependent protease